MTFENRLSSFVQSGISLKTQLSSENTALTSVLLKANQENAWFTEANMRFALNAIAEDLAEKNLRTWTQNYPILQSGISPKTIAVIMAGNIPLVGFRDFLAVLVSGHKILCKLSSKDSILLPYLAQILTEIEPEFTSLICFEDRVVRSFDAIIATGGRQAEEYFQKYFQKYPHLIRGHRNSCAILDGNETAEELHGLFEDMFRYFGLGCRNVTKIFVPQNYDFQQFIQSISHHVELFQALKQHHLHQNNYQYQAVVSSLNMRKTVDTGVFTLIESTSFAPPVSVVHYEYYTNLEDVQQILADQSEHLQVLVSHRDIPFGNAQKPRLSDYADGVDTINFLTKL